MVEENEAYKLNQLPSPHHVPDILLHLRDGTKPCEMKEEKLVISHQSGRQLYIGVKVAERRKAVRGSMSLRACTTESKFSS